MVTLVRCAKDNKDNKIIIRKVYPHSNILVFELSLSPYSQRTRAKQATKGLGKAHQGTKAVAACVSPSRSSNQLDAG